MRPVAGIAIVLLTASAVTGCSGTSAADRTGAAAAGSATTAPTTAPATAGVGPSATATGSGAASGSASGSTATATPTPGSIARTVAPRTVKTLAPVKLTQPAPVSKSLSVRVERTRIGQVDAKWPGETSGTAWIATLVVTNAGSTSVPLDLVTVTARDRGGVPLDAFTSTPATTLPSAVSAKSTATATYVFRLPKSVRNPVTLTFSQSTSTPTVQLSGSVS